MRVAHERRRATRTPDALRVEELISPEILDNEMVDREYLTQVFREPRKYLPPPRVRTRTEPQREPESRGAKLAKLTGLTMAGTLLVGAVVASSVLSRGRDQSAAPVSPAPPQITGAAALGGFAVGGTPGGKQGSNTVGHAQATSTPLPQVPVAQTQPVETGVPETAVGSAPATTTAPALTDADRLAVVNEFYRRVDSAPEKALDLLSPALAGEEAGDLVRAWSTMRQVEVVEAHVQPDGSVLAVVLMRRDDGTRLRVTQQLGLDQAGHSISEAVLLAAEEL
ncbi:hypothetical protein ACFWQL_25750 [Amycolatopsis thermoflava]|uniref:Uncharacterized protein n=1 Tax=Amycolatopsis methanolica 239 TaxID=1068978 RepID=A0A076MJB9_AMYME|nr:hypothetical protein [Amycolatopsis methanolica]AIJ20849.1 hypothetical protein AMETH_0757 [Amycolatopsis methanolica 239]